MSTSTLTSVASSSLSSIVPTPRTFGWVVISTGPVWLQLVFVTSAAFYAVTEDGPLDHKLEPSIDFVIELLIGDWEATLHGAGTIPQTINRVDVAKTHPRITATDSLARSTPNEAQTTGLLNCRVAATTAKVRREGQHHHEKAWAKSFGQGGHQPELHLRKLSYFHEPRQIATTTTTNQSNSRPSSKRSDHETKI